MWVVVVQGWCVVMGKVVGRWRVVDGGCWTTSLNLSWHWKVLTRACKRNHFCTEIRGGV
jgi:hypothetical protein